MAEFTSCCGEETVTNLTSIGTVITYVNEDNVPQSIDICPLIEKCVDGFCVENVEVPSAAFSDVSAPTAAEAITWASANGYPESVTLVYSDGGIVGDSPDYAWAVDCNGNIKQIEAPSAGGSLTRTDNINGSTSYTDGTETFCDEHNVVDERAGSYNHGCDTITRYGSLVVNQSHTGTTAPAGDYEAIAALHSNGGDVINVSTIDDKMVAVSNFSDATGKNSAVIASENGDSTGSQSFVASTLTGVASGSESTVLSTRTSEASGNQSSIISVINSEAGGQRNSIIASNNVDTNIGTAASECGSIGALNGTVMGTQSYIIASTSSTVGGAGSDKGMTTISSEFGEITNNYSSILANQRSKINSQYSAIVGGGYMEVFGTLMNSAFNTRFGVTELSTYTSMINCKGTTISAGVPGRCYMDASQSVMINANAAVPADAEVIGFKIATINQDRISATQNRSVILGAGLTTSDVGVQTTTPTESLDTIGNTKTSGLFITSDPQFKEEIKGRDTKEDLAAVLSTNPVNYKWIDSYDPDLETRDEKLEHIGFDASDLKKSIPLAVKDVYSRKQYEIEDYEVEVEVKDPVFSWETDKKTGKKVRVKTFETKSVKEMHQRETDKVISGGDPTGELVIEPVALISVLFGAVQEQQKQIDDLTSRINKIENPKTK